MNSAWFAGELAAVAAGSGLAVIVIRRWLAPLLSPFTAAERRYAIGHAARIAAAGTVVPLAIGLFLMWLHPATAVADFVTAGFGFTIAGWFEGRRIRAVRDSGGREPSPTDRD